MYNCNKRFLLITILTFVPCTYAWCAQLRARRLRAAAPGKTAYSRMGISRDPRSFRWAWRSRLRCRKSQPCSDWVSRIPRSAPPRQASPSCTARIWREASRSSGYCARSRRTSSPGVGGCRGRATIASGRSSSSPGRPGGVKRGRMF